ncbi:MAG TPA: hypothetical protein VF718_05865 [Allosphingosinicella sp.]|jgi:hypothetical protein
MSHQRILASGAAAALLVAAAAGAALAHPHPEGDGKRVERIIIIGDGAGGEHHASAGAPEIRRFELHRNGGDSKGGSEVRRFELHRVDGDGKPGGPRVRRFEMHGDALARCDGGDKVVNESSDEGDKKTKVIICTKGQPTAATAQRLEEALERINDNDALSAEAKARIAIALKSAIDRARGAR